MIGTRRRPEERRIQHVRLDRLRPHPLNEKLYGASRPDKELLDSIREHGILEPLIVAENLIISGHRRWQAAKIITAENKQSEKTIYLMTMRPDHSPNDAWYEDEAKYKFWRENPLLLEQLIIEANRQRVKTKGQIAREAAELMRIEKALAATRRESALKKGKKTPVTPSKGGTGGKVDVETLIKELSQRILNRDGENFQKQNNSDGSALYWWSRNKVRLRVSQLGLKLDERRWLWYGVSENIWKAGWRGNSVHDRGRREAYIFRWRSKDTTQEPMPEDWAPTTDMMDRPEYATAEQRAKADEALVRPSEGQTEGRASEIVAGKLGQSKNTVEKEVAIVSAAEAGDPKAQEVLAKLDRNEISVAAAHRAVITPQRKVEDASKNLRRIEAAAACIKGSAVAPLLKVRQINTAKEQAAVLALRADLQCLLDHLGRLL